jgi:hypothetical protein
VCQPYNYVSDNTSDFGISCRVLIPSDTWSFETSIFALFYVVSSVSWFHGELTRADADKLLDNQPPGTYLLRKGSKPRQLVFVIRYIPGSPSGKRTESP